MKLSSRIATRGFIKKNGFSEAISNCAFCDNNGMRV